MKNIRPSLTINAIWNVTATLTNGCVAFIALPILVGELGVSDYGLLALVLSIGGIIALADMGLNEATIKYVAQYYSRKDIEGINRVYGATSFVYTIVGVLGLFFIIYSASWIVGFFNLPSNKIEVAVHCIKVGGVSFIIGIWVGVIQAIPQALQRYDVLVKLQIMTNLANYSGFVVLVMQGYGVDTIVIWMLFVRLINLLASWFLAHALLPSFSLFPKPSLSGLKEVFSYGIYSSLNGAVTKISANIDRLLLGAYLGPAQITYLDIPKQVLDQASYVHGSAGQVLFPRFSSIMSKQIALNTFLKSAYILLFVSLIIFVPFIIILPDFLRIWVGNKIASEASWTAQLIAGSYAIQGPFATYFAFLRGTGRVRYITYINITLGVLSVAFSIILIKIFGLPGAGYRVWCFVWVGYLVIFIILHKILNQTNSFGIFLTYFFRPICVALITGYCSYLVYSHINVQDWFSLAVAWLAVLIVLMLSLYITNYGTLRKQLKII